MVSLIWRFKKRGFFNLQIKKGTVLPVVDSPSPIRFYLILTVALPAHH